MARCAPCRAFPPFSLDLSVGEGGGEARRVVRRFKVATLSPRALARGCSTHLASPPRTADLSTGLFLIFLHTVLLGQTIDKGGRAPVRCPGVVAVTLIFSWAHSSPFFFVGRDELWEDELL